MKKFLLIIYSLIIFLLITLNILKYLDYNKETTKLNKILNNNNYENYYNELNNKIDNYLKLVYNKYQLENLTKENIILLNKNVKDNNLKLTNDIPIKEEKISSLKEQASILNERYNQLVAEDIARRTFLIENVMKINQYNIGYPTGCESAALTILLNYWQVPVNISEIVDILPKGDKPYIEDGIKYGGNPYIEFIGHPTDYYSYGVYDEPINNIANHFKSGMINGRGMSLNQVLEIVKQNRPVIVWNSMNLTLPHISNSWIYKNTGETINWLADLHALVVIGYNDNQIITSDSLTGTIRYFDRWTFENRYNAFGKRALYY